MTKRLSVCFLILGLSLTPTSLCAQVVGDGPPEAAIEFDTSLVFTDFNGNQASFIDAIEHNSFLAGECIDVDTGSVVSYWSMTDINTGVGHVVAYDNASGEYYMVFFDSNVVGYFDAMNSNALALQTASYNNSGRIIFEILKRIFVRTVPKATPKVLPKTNIPKPPTAGGPWTQGPSSGGKTIWKRTRPDGKVEVKTTDDIVVGSGPSAGGGTPPPGGN